MVMVHQQWTTAFPSRYLGLHAAMKIQVTMIQKMINFIIEAGASGDDYLLLELVKIINLHNFII